MERKRVVVLFADIYGSTDFGMRQTPEEYNAMMRAFHRMAHQAVTGYREQQGLNGGRVYARAVGDECFLLLTGGAPNEDECHAMRLAVRLKQGWINSDLGKRLAQAHATGLLPEVDLRVGVGCGEVVFDDDVWTGHATPEGTIISEAKRIESAAGELAPKTYILVKLDIKEAAEKAGLGIVFGDRSYPQAKGFVGGTHQVPVYPVVSWAEFRDVQEDLVPRPETATDYFNRAFALQRSGAPEAAVEAYQRAIDLQGQYAHAWNNLGVGLFTLRRYPEAIRAYQEVLSSDPKDEMAWYNLGLAHKALGQWDQAISAYRRALDERQAYPEAWNEMALALMAKSDLPQALAVLSEAERLAPGYPDTMYNRACVHSLQGETRPAVEHLARAIELKDALRDAAKTDQDFDSIRNNPAFRKLVYGVGS